MKPLAFALLLAALPVVAAEAPPPGVDVEFNDTTKVGDTSGLRTRFGKMPQARTGVALPPAPDSAPEPVNDALPLRQVVTVKSGGPALYGHTVKGLDGYTLKELTQNLDWTRHNLDALLDYLMPSQGAEAPSGKAAENALKGLAEESALAKVLIEEGEKALAKGIQRAALDKSEGIPPSFAVALRASLRYTDPNPNQKLQSLAADQANACGLLRSLIILKGRNPAENEAESHYEALLQRTREYLKAP